MAARYLATTLRRRFRERLQALRTTPPPFERRPDLQMPHPWLAVVR
jgi:hypothetical protein